VPGSHKSRFRMPERVRTVDDDMGLVVQPVMEAGDVLFFAETATHGTLPWKGKGERRSILYKYASRAVARATGHLYTPEERYGEWTKELTAEQHSLLYGPGHHIGGKKRYALESDGKQVRLANQAFDYCWDKFSTAPAGRGAKGSKALAGTGRLEMHGLMQLPGPYCYPFRQMIAHPAIVLKLNMMCGKRFRLDHGPLIITGVEGTEGLTLHGQGEPHNPCVASHQQNDTTLWWGHR